MHVCIRINLCVIILLVVEGERKSRYNDDLAQEGQIDHHPSIFLLVRLFQSALISVLKNLFNNQTTHSIILNIWRADLAAYSLMI